MLTRLFSSCARIGSKSPRFVATLKKASEPALSKSEPTTRPFGYSLPTTLEAHDWSWTLLFSESASDKRLRQLNHDIKHSAFYESKSFQNTNGKIFTPPQSYFRRDKALYFPLFVNKNLEGQSVKLSDLWKDHVTLVRVYSTMSGEKCASTYLNEYLSKEGGEKLAQKFPNTQIVDLNVPQSTVKGLFVHAAKSNLRKTIPPHRVDKYFIVPAGLFDVDVRHTLRCNNTCLGYVYVLDDSGKIRWATSGYALDAELEVLWRTVEGLEKELATALVAPATK